MFVINNKYKYRKIHSNQLMLTMIFLDFIYIGYIN